MHSNETAGVILGGGEGRRLGGVIKPLLRADGVAVLARTIARLRPHVAPLLVSTGRIDPTRFAGFDTDALVPDRADAAGGPLAGIFAAATVLRADGAAPDWLLSVAGDCPDLPEDLPEVLAAAAGPGIDVVFASYGGQAYPPNALWRFAALAAHMDTLGGDPQGRGPRQLVAPENRRDADFAPRLAANPFEGFNTLADIVARARRRRVA